MVVRHGNRVAAPTNRLQQGAREKLAGGDGARFWGWEVVLVFYDIVIAVDGYAEIKGMPVPKSHEARRFLVERYLPHLVDPYDDLYSLSLKARYYKGYTMTEKAWFEAARCHEILARAIPVQ